MTFDSRAIISYNTGILKKGYKMAQTKYQKTLTTIKLKPSVMQLMQEYIHSIDTTTGIKMSNPQAIEVALKIAFKSIK